MHPRSTSSNAPASLRGADAGLMALLVLLAFALRIPFRYEGGFGDANVIHMAAGMARGIAQSLPLGETLQYGKNFSLGVYVGFRWVYPLFFHDASHTVAFLNAVGLLAGSVVYAPLYLTFRTTLSRPAAVGAALVVMFTPVVWDNETYFQPITLALLFFLLAFLCARRMGGTPRGLGLAIAAFAFGLAAVLCRAEIVLGIPALWLASWRHGGRRRLGATIALTAAVGVATLVLLRTVGSGSGTAGSDLLPYVRSFVATYLVPRSVARNLVWGGLGMGVASIAGAAWVLLRRRAIESRGARFADEGAASSESRTRVDTASLLLWMGTVVLFWMWNPVPLLRHFYLVVPALAWLLGETLFSGVSWKRCVLLAALVGACNLALPEFVYAAYHAGRPSGSRPTAGSALELPGSQTPVKTPHGTFFSWHAHRNAEVQQAREFARGVVARISREVEEGAGDAPHRLPADASSMQAGDESPVHRFLVQMNWELSGYVQYTLAAVGIPLDRYDGAVLDPGVVIQEYRGDGIDLREVRTNWLIEAGVRRVVRQEIDRALATDVDVVVPRENAAALGLTTSSSGRLSIE